ncbi:hypothetical protein BD309DRAFT_869119 [Dichomitus squalens]|uniref:Uncharacterized protein n=1 Tax=Dichomitus squalens TaxID=114155 RepID=A0A4V2K8D2_9APHY|nr:hypothetical protein BD309DRAFT_869119 [Dichomitus squalens]TBU59518.1 hypothetical protein BD310DRAFT_947934 [Dichomitus squalens]
MSDDPAKTFTRPTLKSCLKLTPPITPDLSAAPSPCTSGRTSPSLASDIDSRCSSAGRKTVSFCGGNELEEIFFADEWDRTPAAVTPKLSYQDILELKQLRINLPYSPPPPPPRQPFTTSLPSTAKPAFPISRFATAASHTPSKWKNRSEPQRHDVDPAILPYLDAVPIRLLPLLPQSSPEPEPPSDAPEPHPQTPTPTASPEARPTIQPPSEPPELRIVEPAIPAPVQPTPSLSPSAPSQPRTKKPNFSFLPLLPIEDTPAPAAPIIQSAPIPPRRKFNMTFLPVNAMPDLEPSSSSAQNLIDQGTCTLSTSAPLPSLALSVIGTDPSTQTDAGHLSSGAAEVASLTPTTSTSDAPTMSPPPLSLTLPDTSQLSIAVESDTDTDNYTDTDAESDAPSTSTVASSLPSPPCEFESSGGELDELKLGKELVFSDNLPRIHPQSDAGSYFPPVPIEILDLSNLPGHVQLTEVAYSTGPGQTPPLSVLYPSPRSQPRTLPPLDAALVPGSVEPSEGTPVVPASLEDDATVPPPPFRPAISLPPSLVGSASTGESSLPTTPLSMNRVLQQKLTLEALPSPALAPPSPFELEPHHIRAGASPKRLSFAAASAADGDIITQKLGGLCVEESAEPARPDATPVLRAAGTPSGESSPMLTLEGLRASWDAKARERIAMSRAGPVLVPSLIAPSLSRRRSS